MFWTGWVISIPPILMMTIMPILFYSTQRSKMTEMMQKYGYSQQDVLPIVITEIACAVVFAIPQTAVLGAILLTGYLGGATATHVRAGEPFLFPVLFGVLVWLGLFFRDSRVRALLPFR